MTAPPPDRDPAPPPLAADDRVTPLLFPFAEADYVRTVQRGYVRHFTGARRVLDIGSGRGIFLELLRDAGIEATGIDASAATAEPVRANGFRVHVGDAIAETARLAAAGERFDGVYCSHLIEHLTPPAALDLVAAIAQVLAPGGRAVFVTPNPRCPEVIGHGFWLDPTHIRPYPRMLIEQMGAAHGLRTLESYDDPATLRLRGVLRRARRRIATWLTGRDPHPPMDSVVVLGRA